VLILGKALSGGTYPVSAVVSSREILGVFRPGSNGSTYGGNPLVCAVARAALRVIEQERLEERSEELGAGSKPNPDAERLRRGFKRECDSLFAKMRDRQVHAIAGKPNSYSFIHGANYTCSRRSQ
jgi:acetylornithine/succinyldiaminopimelate/putrescine aminotransferase